MDASTSASTRPVARGHARTEDAGPPAAGDELLGPHPFEVGAVDRGLEVLGQLLLEVGAAGERRPAERSSASATRWWASHSRSWSSGASRATRRSRPGSISSVRWVASSRSKRSTTPGRAVPALDEATTSDEASGGAGPVAGTVPASRASAQVADAAAALGPVGRLRHPLLQLVDALGRVREHGPVLGLGGARARYRSPARRSPLPTGPQPGGRPRVHHAGRAGRGGRRRRGSSAARGRPVSRGGIREPLGGGVRPRS